jgi:hypothetical protein
MDPSDGKAPTRTGPVEWFERISRLGDDFRKIGKASIVPAVPLAILSPAVVDHLSNPEQYFYLACIRTFPLTVTVAVIIITGNIWNTSKRLNGYWLMAIWFVSIYVSINLAAHFGCNACGKFEDITAQTDSWLPKVFSVWGGYLLAFLITAVIYFFKLFGWGSFLSSLICGSYLGLAGIYVLRPGGPLDWNGKLE